MLPAVYLFYKRVRAESAGAVPQLKTSAPVFNKIAAPYQFEVLPRVGHYAADQVPERVNELLLAHLARHAG